MKKVAEEKKPFEPIVIEGTIPYKLTITEEEYNIDYTPSIGHDFAAVLIARRITEGLVTDIERFKKMKTKLKQSDKVFMNTNYANLLKSSVSLGNISDQLLTEALEMSKKK